MEKNLKKDLEKLVSDLNTLYDKKAKNLQSEATINIYREDYFKKRKNDIINFDLGIQKVISLHANNSFMYDTVYNQCKKDAAVIAIAINEIP